MGLVTENFASNLDECDVPPLSALDCEGCGTDTQIEYVLSYTELCILISHVLRERFALRITPEQRKAALAAADEALANWCLQLPPSLHLRSLGTSLWTSSLHLAYSNFLILLHRPNPRASRRLDDSGPNDADICIAAANTITTIFEDLRKTGQIRYVSLVGINALFTGMIQVSVELRFSNPVLAIHARRRFESTLHSLREIAEYWIVGESILRLFEETSIAQHTKGLRKDSREEDRPQSAAMDQMLGNGSTIARKAFQAPQAEKKLPQRAQSDLDVLAAAANAAVQSINAGLIEQEQEEVCDWRQLFPFYTSNQEEFMLTEDITLMEDEWREIYWQEPNMPGAFGEAFGTWL
jgi:transcriptional regulatory protein AMDR